MTRAQSLAPAPIDALQACPDGRYEDDLVVVHTRTGPPGRLAAYRSADGRVRVEHALDGCRLDDDLAELLAARLQPVTTSHEVFARAFTGVVLTSAADPLVAWRRFYRNNAARVRDTSRPGYPAIYRHALDLLPRTRVLDLGCGFGFLALHLADLGVDVVACDSDDGPLRLLDAVGGCVRRRVSILHTRGPEVDLAPCSVDGVAMLHVLEHLDRPTGTALLLEAMRVARRRVVVAVPFEDTPQTLFGHVRAFDLAELHELGSGSGWTFDVHEHLGGWLVLDRPSDERPGHPTG